MRVQRELDVMTGMTKPGPPDLGAHKAIGRELGHYVRSIGAFQEEVPAPTSRLAWVPQALGARILSSSACAVLAFRDGYTHDAQTLTRSIAGAVISHAAMLQGDTDARAYLFLAQGLARARRQRHNLVLAGTMDAAMDAAVSRAMEEQWATQLKELWPGVVPAKLGSGRETWSGLGDADLADRIGATSLYRLVFAPLSDATHVTSLVVQAVLESLTQIGHLSIGPDFKEGVFFAMALLKCLDVFAERTIDFYGIREGQARRLALAERLTVAIADYSKAIGVDQRIAEAQTVIRAHLAPRPTPST